ncbi:hypothetical protein BDZ91DRAFT_694978 [Kalaharituber pfeilii]|nr:hypothetical protein BDZ91DRAFT_694978 [Kalaharituber pfeilii]
MSCPEKIVTIFELARLGGEKDESEWYGPYNALLNHVFPVEEDYVVVPQYQRPEQLKSVDFTTIFIVRRKRHPVLFLEVKATNHISHISKREAADQQMRDRFKDLFDDVKIPRLYGISALGAKICLYTLDRDTGDIMPEEIPTSRVRIMDTAPAHRWSLDIVTPEGYGRFQEVVAEVKAMCRQL